MDIAEVTEARVITVKPGDVVAIRLNQMLSRAARDRLASYAEQVLGCPVLVLDEGMEFNVLRTEG